MSLLLDDLLHTDPSTPTSRESWDKGEEDSSVGFKNCKTIMRKIDWKTTGIHIVPWEYFSSQISH